VALAIFAMLLGVSGFLVLNLFPFLSIEKLRYGAVKIELFDLHHQEDDSQNELDHKSDGDRNDNKNGKGTGKKKKTSAEIQEQLRLAKIEKRRELINRIRLSHGGEAANPKARKVIILHKAPESYVPLQDITYEMIHALIVSEDMKFYTHPGVDYEQISHAFDSYRRGRPLRGASTITQQLVKNVFLSSERNYVRKVREFLIALYLDYRLPKNKILELYLNAVEFGPNIWGIKAAANYYFNKLPGQLNAKESAFLVMLLPSPIRYSASFTRHQLSEYARGTINSILFKMKINGYISGNKYFEALSSTLSFERPTVNTSDL